MTDKIRTVPTTVEQQRGVYRLHPLGLATVVSIVIFEELPHHPGFAGKWSWTCSHKLQTPLMEEPFVLDKAEITGYTEVHQVFQTLLRGLEGSMQVARAAGHQPRESWLIEV